MYGSYTCAVIEELKEIDFWQFLTGRMMICYIQYKWMNHMDAGLACVNTCRMQARSLFHRPLSLSYFWPSLTPSVLNFWTTKLHMQINSSSHGPQLVARRWSQNKSVLISIWTLFAIIWHADPTYNWRWRIWVHVARCLTDYIVGQSGIVSGATLHLSHCRTVMQLEVTLRFQCSGIALMLWQSLQGNINSGQTQHGLCSHSQRA